MKELDRNETNLVFTLTVLKKQRIENSLFVRYIIPDRKYIPFPYIYNKEFFLVEKKEKGENIEDERSGRDAH